MRRRSSSTRRKPSRSPSSWRGPAPTGGAAARMGHSEGTCRRRHRRAHPCLRSCRSRGRGRPKRRSASLLRGDATGLGRRGEALRALRQRRGAHRPLDRDEFVGRLPPGHGRGLDLLRVRLAHRLGRRSSPSSSSSGEPPSRSSPPAARRLARCAGRRSRLLQNTIIVGAGDVGQLVARKLLQHPEYGLNLVGFVDAEPKAPRRDLDHLTLLGPAEELPEIVRASTSSASSSPSRTSRTRRCSTSSAR